MPLNPKRGEQPSKARKNRHADRTGAGRAHDYCMANACKAPDRWTLELRVKSCRAMVNASQCPVKHGSKGLSRCGSNTCRMPVKPTGACRSNTCHTPVECKPLGVVKHVMWDCRCNKARHVRM